MNNTFPTEGNLSGLSRKDFQKEINNKETDLFILTNDNGAEMAITNYGGAILAIMVPDKNGKLANVVQGHGFCYVVDDVGYVVHGGDELVELLAVNGGDEGFMQHGVDCMGDGVGTVFSINDLLRVLLPLRGVCVVRYQLG